MLQEAGTLTDTGRRCLSDSTSIWSPGKLILTCFFQLYWLVKMCWWLCCCRRRRVYWLLLSRQRSSQACPSHKGLFSPEKLPPSSFNLLRRKLRSIHRWGLHQISRDSWRHHRRHVLKARGRDFAEVDWRLQSTRSPADHTFFSGGGHRRKDDLGFSFWTKLISCALGRKTFSKIFLNSFPRERFIFDRVHCSGRDRIVSRLLSIEWRNPIWWWNRPHQKYIYLILSNILSNTLSNLLSNISNMLLYTLSNIYVQNRNIVEY